MPSSVNSLVTDSVAQTGVVTIASSPAVAIGMLYQAVAQAMAIAANNASSLQLNGANVTMAVSSTACAMIMAQQPKTTTKG
jgi:hypothetical protein